MLSSPLAAVLRSGRAELNAQFAAARHQLPHLDGAAFAAFLKSTVDPWVVATAGLAPERVTEVAGAGFEVGLELVGQRLAGPAALDPWIGEGLRRLLPVAARAAAADPARAMTALANALHQLATTPEARPADWIAVLAELAPRAGDLDELLRAGQVAAWRAGLAHFRAGALAVADALPAELALAAVGAGPEADWKELRRALERDPWFVPGSGEPAVGVARTAGAFRGFGGLFTAPPRVAAGGGQLLVTSGGETWVLCADAFGATFHRAGEEPPAKAGTGSLPEGGRLTPGALAWQGATIALPPCRKVTSFAALPSTLALTFELTHEVVLVAVGAPG